MKVRNFRQTLAHTARAALTKQVEAFYSEMGHCEQPKPELHRRVKAFLKPVRAPSMVMRRSSAFSENQLWNMDCVSSWWDGRN